MKTEVGTHGFVMLHDQHAAWRALDKLGRLTSLDDVFGRCVWTLCLDDVLGRCAWTMCLDDVFIDVCGRWGWTGFARSMCFDNVLECSRTCA